MSHEFITDPTYNERLDPATETLAVRTIPAEAEITPLDYYVEYYAALRSLQDYHCGHSGLV